MDQNEKDRENLRRFHEANTKPKRWIIRCENGSCGVSYPSDRPHYNEKCPRCGFAQRCDME